jgi:glycine dehydrogenase
MLSSAQSLHELEQTDDFISRHIGPHVADTAAMLEHIGMVSLEALIDAAVPATIRDTSPMDLPPSRTEADVLSELREMAQSNTVGKSLIGMAITTVSRRRLYCVT